MINSELTSPIKVKRLTSNMQLLFGVGVALFVGVISIVIVALQSGRTTVAPNAPESRPQAAEFTSNTCSLTFNAAEGTTGTIGTCKKMVFQDEFDNTPGFYSLRKIIQTAKAGQQIVWVIEATNNSDIERTITLTDPIPANLMTYVDSDCGSTAFNNDTVTCDFINVLPGKTARKHIRVKLKDDLALNTLIKNTAELAPQLPLTASTCEASVTIAQVSDQRQCNEPCQSDKECSEAAGHVCYQTNEGFFCRLETDPTSPTCSGPTPTPTTIASATPTPGATATPTATPLASCNASCTSNADCANTNHICVEIGGSRVCRLASNVNSSTCSPAGATATPTFTPTASPSVTPGLPSAGNESRSTIIILAAGIAVLILGSVAFLLLL